MNPSSDQWVQTQPLILVISRFLRLQRHDVLTASLLAQLAKRLLASETAVGGPYAEPGQPIDTITNQLIAQFFRRAGTPLPQLAPYDIIEQTPAMTSRRYNSVHKAVSNELATFDTTYGNLPMSLFKKIVATDEHNELSQLTEYFATSLPGCRIPSTQLLRFGTANLYAWMAYALYDSLIDDESNERQIISLANQLLRRAIYHYGRADAVLVNHFFDRTDSAVHREFVTARTHVTDEVIFIPPLPTNLNPAEKSIAHIIGPMIIAKRAGLNTHQRSLVERGLMHYLTARQLHDDIHDWRNDFTHGHLSPVVCQLLREAKIKPGHYNLTDLRKALERIFWDNELRMITRKIEGHIMRAEEFLRNGSGMSAQSNFYIQILQPTLQSARQMRKAHAEHRAFTKDYLAA